MMLYNIITGYRHPLVQRRSRSEILVIRCLISDLATLPQWFFTNGQANDMASSHYNNLADLNQIDWQSIQNSDFSKNDGDYDRPRRYQAEFLVHTQVPLASIDSLNVYDNKTAEIATNTLLQNNINLAINIQPQYFFPI